MNLAKLAIAAALVVGNATVSFGDTGQVFSPGIIPWPKTIAASTGDLKLKTNLTIGADDSALLPLAKILAGEINAVAGVHATVAKSSSSADIVLKLTAAKKGEAYELTVADRIMVAGANYQSVAEGSATIVQAIQIKDGSAQIAKMKITDSSDTDYRGLMIDLARQFHPVANLEQIIEMCRFYKIRYLHLHLSDDQSFTFPSRAYPKMATKGRSYSQAEMKALVKFADEHGVTIVPEIDMPAHASSIIAAIPELGSPAGNIINFADPKGIKEACTLVDEMAEMFPQSPYIHIGGDEANLGPLVSDPKFTKAIADHKVGDINGLFNYFLNQLDDRVKSHKKRTITWEGFSIQPEGPARVHPDVIVEPFDNYSNAQTTYIADGHDLINTSWFPMYVLHESLFGPQSIYDWDLYTFGNYKGAAPRNYEDVTQYKVTSEDKVLGAQVCSWEQGSETEIPTIRRRLPAMSERVWNRASTLPYDDFARRLDSTDAMLTALLTTKIPGPVMASASDSVYPDRVVIQWAAPADYPNKYTVLRGESDNASAATAIATDISATQFVDHTADDGKTYYYWVKAGNHFGYGPIDKSTTGSRGTSTKLVAAYEGFETATGTSLAGIADGDGWSGPWEVKKEQAKMSFKPEGLSYPGLKTTGGCLNFQFSNDKDMVDVSRPTVGLQGVPGTQMWMSFLMRANKIGDGHFLLTSSAASNVAIGKSWGNGLCIYGYSTNVAMVPGQTYLVVVRFDCMNPKDTAYIWVNPALDKEPDTNLPGVPRDPEASAGTGKIFQFSSQGYGEGDYDLDEVRLGSTWRDVLPLQ